MTFCIQCRQFFAPTDYLDHCCSQQRTYVCPWCEFTGNALAYWHHRCPDMVEALELFSTVPQPPLNGETGSAARPALTLVSPSPKGDQP